MQHLYEKYQSSGLEIVAVGVDKDHSAALKFLEQNPVSFPVVFDSSGNLAELYELEAMPTSFIYDRKGILDSHHRGFHEEETDALDNLIYKLLKQEDSK